VRSLRCIEGHLRRLEAELDAAFPPVDLAVTVHAGPHDDIDVTYGRLGDWVVPFFTSLRPSTLVAATGFTRRPGEVIPHAGPDLDPPSGRDRTVAA
jgi:hypothetical protein